MPFAIIYAYEHGDTHYWYLDGVKLVHAIVTQHSYVYVDAHDLKKGRYIFDEACRRFYRERFRSVFLPRFEVLNPKQYRRNNYEFRFETDFLRRVLNLMRP